MIFFAFVWIRHTDILLILLYEKNVLTVSSVDIQHKGKPIRLVPTSNTLISDNWIFNWSASGIRNTQDFLGVWYKCYLLYIEITLENQIILFNSNKNFFHYSLYPLKWSIRIEYNSFKSLSSNMYSPFKTFSLYFFALSKR